MDAPECIEKPSHKISKQVRINPWITDSKPEGMQTEPLDASAEPRLPLDGDEYHNRQF
jgi:hypothetical protein